VDDGASAVATLSSYVMAPLVWAPQHQENVGPSLSTLIDLTRNDHLVAPTDNANGVSNKFEASFSRKQPQTTNIRNVGSTMKDVRKGHAARLPSTGCAALSVFRIGGYATWSTLLIEAVTKVTVLACTFIVPSLFLGFREEFLGFQWESSTLRRKH
jgi:hypothetical protein